MANTARVRRVADLIIERYLQKGSKVVVVVSAMAGMTDQLSRTLDEMKESTYNQRLPEEDLILSTGESVTTALLAMALTQRGFPAQSFLGWQLPLVTSEDVRQARILQVTAGNLWASLDEGKIPVVAGFQGVTEQGRVTTLGRGGSDTTAVALAAALRAETCDIFTDVDGVYTADPRQVPNAIKRAYISFNDMLEMASTGAKVLQARSVAYAANNQVVVRVLSSFVPDEGTIVGGLSEEENMEQAKLTGITQQKNVIKVDLSAKDLQVVLKELWAQAAPLDLLTKDFSSDNSRLSFLISAENIREIENLLGRLQREGLIQEFSFDHHISRIALVGAGVGCDNIVPSTLLNVCLEQNIPLLALSVTPSRVDLITDLTHADLAVLALHTAFETVLMNTSAL